ncbi:hypothetical protein AGDE_08191 [Angomonas deanei]|uniref:WWE domain containing protein, putative n=1 Tax=Angomonas deanei TaxID=59799 RepID=A0A7G2CIN3_9TRYP|nr:hypothetical protein AGDE_08191 [Angomonas deanei]CAD2218917.1 WWE domain containing protein, putative [Angomonas deanei]|eukprot:EPY33623.1 hypothetical protein AGDE_08191 [Angomonas deanei]
MSKGSFAVVRSDKHVLHITKPNTLYIIGRGKSLPTSQSIAQSKYIARHQIGLLWDDKKNVLSVGQLGRNPTFFSKSIAVPKVNVEGDVTDDMEKLMCAFLSTPNLLTFTPANNVSEAVVQGNTSVLIPYTDSTAIAVPPALSQIGASTLFFPPELGLPVLDIRYEGVQQHATETAASMDVPASISLAVPTMTDLEDDAKEAEKPSTATGWKGILDDAMQKQRQEATRKQFETEEKETEVKTTAEAPKKAVVPSPPEPSAPTVIPFGTATKLETSSFEAKPKVEAPPPEPKPVTPFGMAAAEKAAPIPTAAPQKTGAIGFWKWKCHSNGSDSDPKSWRKYSLAVAQLLEKAFVDKERKVKIPDSLLKNDPSAKGSTYSVCFAEKSLKGAMIQYQNDDPSKFRIVQRDGGPDVDRKRVRPISVLPSESDESDYSDDDDDTESSSESLTSSSESSTSHRRKRRKTK